MKRDEGGSMEFLPGSVFRVSHRHSFVFNEMAGCFELDENPYGSRRLISVRNFSVSSGGFSFFVGDKKRVVRVPDDGSLARAVAEYLSSVVKEFEFSEGYHASFSCEWDEGMLVSAKFASWEKGFSSDFFSLEQEHGVLYTGFPPLIDRIVVSEILFGWDEVEFRTESADVEYACRVQPDVLAFMKKCFQSGSTVKVL